MTYDIQNILLSLSSMQSIIQLLMCEALGTIQFKLVTLCSIAVCLSTEQMERTIFYVQKEIHVHIGSEHKPG